LGSKVLAPVFLALAYALGGILLFIARIFRAVGLKNLSQDVQVGVKSFKEIAKTGDESALAPGGNVLVIILIVLGSAILALLIFLIVRRIAGNRSTGDSAGKALAGSSAKVNPQGRASSEHGPREQVRNVYKKFLKHLTSLGVRIEHSDTSLIVSNKAAERFDDVPLRELRQVYIEARYNPSAHVTKADARRAKDIAERLRDRVEKARGGAPGK
jgi:hypothetical protein